MRVRTSILGLMGVIALAGVGLAALRTASALWASALFTLALLATIAATVGAIATRGRARATCGGFAVACGAYLGMAFLVLHTAGGVEPPPLLTSLLFSKTADRLGEPTAMFHADEVEDSLDDASYLELYQLAPRVIGEPLGDQPVSMQSLAPGRLVHRIHHYRIGHALAALVLGLGGAALGRGLSTRAEADDGA